MPRKSYRQALNEALHHEMARDPKVIVLGEDITGGAGASGEQDAWGGAFGVTKGLLGAFGRGRVRDTPITESAFVGAAAGAAMTGLRPVVEIMFVDFLGVCFDQIFNQAAKFRYMFGGHAVTPLVIRTTYGAGTRSASQHSQTLYPIFTHLPGLKVVIPANPYDAKGLLIQAIRGDDSVVFLESKLLDDITGEAPDRAYTVPFAEAAIVREGRHALIVALGRMVGLAERAAATLAKEGIDCTVLDPRTTSPFDRETVLEMVAANDGRVVIVGGEPALRDGGRHRVAHRRGGVRRAAGAGAQGDPAAHARALRAGPGQDRGRRAARGRPRGVTPVPDRVRAIAMPRWGMTMTEGTVAAWLVAEGARVEPGQEVAEIETSKITNVLEATAGGLLRRRLLGEGEVAAVGALLGVLAEADVDEAEIDRFVAAHRAREGAVEAAARAEAAPRLVAAGPAEVNVLTAGEGGAAVPVVLVHGFGGSIDAWAYNQAALAEGGRAVHALDLPAHGASEPTGAPATVAGLAEVVAALLDALGLDRAHLVGHSLGGAVALEVARSRPERVASLALIAPVGLGPEIDAGYLEGFLAAERRKPMREALSRLYADPSAISGETVEGALRMKRQDGVPEALRAMADALVAAGRQAVDLRGALDGLRAPCLVVWGEGDRVIPSFHADGLPPSVRVERVAAAAHMPQVEQAGAVNRLLLDHLARAEAAR